MATTTPNFGFDIPQSTDLVKDGATAIAALGTDIDTAFVDLKGGTTGQVLAKASNTDLDYTWTTPAGGGKVLQVVSAVKTDTFTSTSTTPVDITGLSVTITPSATSSKIYVITSISGNGKNASNQAIFRLLRGSTNLLEPSSPADRAAGAIAVFVDNASALGNGSITYLDSPSSTSSLAYTVFFKTTNASSQVNMFRDDTQGSIILMEIAG
jgi:hypothetical protein